MQNTEIPRATQASNVPVLHLIETTGPGGAESVFLYLTYALPRASYGRYHHVIGLPVSGWLHNKLSEHNYPVQLLRSGKSPDLYLLWSLCSIVRRMKIKLIHSHLPDMNFYSSIAATLCKVKHVATEHGDIHNNSKYSSRFLQKYFLTAKFTDHIICVSDYTKMNLLDRVPKAVSKCEVIYNGVSPPKNQQPQAKSIKEELAIDRDAIIVTNVANLYEVKGQIYLIRAIAKVLQEFPNLHLLVAGRGDMESRLKREAGELDVTKNVHFLGFREDVPSLLIETDIFVLPSLSEGFPVSLIEAMHAGLPLIASRVGGIPELEDLGADIRLVPPKAEIELGDAILEAVRSGNFKSKINQKIALRYFSVDAMANGYIRIYDKLLGY